MDLPKSLYSLIEKLTEQVPVVLLLLGTFLLICAAAGKVPFTELQMPQADWRIAVAILAVVFAVAGLWLSYRGTLAPRAMVPTAYKVKIDRPRQGDVIDQLFTIEGTYAPPLPPGYDLDVIEVWPNWGTYRWKARASRDGKGTWKATQVWGAGEAGEERAFIIAITGQGGRALFDFYGAVNEKSKGEGVPPLQTLTPDTSECDRVYVRCRGPRT